MLYYFSFLRLYHFYDSEFDIIIWGFHGFLWVVMEKFMWNVSWISSLDQNRIDFNYHIDYLERAGDREGGTLTFQSFVWLWVSWDSLCILWDFMENDSFMNWTRYKIEWHNLEIKIILFKIYLYNKSLQIAIFV